jgi:hypothetical protein
MRLEGAPAGNDCGRALVTRAVGHVHSLVKARPRWARMRGKRRGWVGPGTDSRRGRVGLGTDSSSGRGCGHKRFRANAWEWAQTCATGHRLEARTRRTGHGLVELGANSSCARGCGREHRVRA